MSTPRTVATATTRRTVTAVLAAALTALVVAGCSSTSTATMSSSAAAGNPAAEFAAAPNGGADAGVAADAPAGPAAVAGGAASSSAAAPSALDNRQIIRTGDLQIRLGIPADVEDYDKARQEALTAAVAGARSQALGVGGFVADLRQSDGSASLVLRVPVDQFDTFRTAAGALGEVTSTTENAVDVTDEYTDVVNRIAALQTSVDRIRTLLAQATNMADIISLESELSAREADLESLKGRQAVLADQVALATVSITFSAGRNEVGTVEQAPEQGGFLGGLADGWDALVGFLSGLSVVIGALLPFVPVLLIVGAVVWFVIRRLRARRDDTGRPGNPTANPTSSEQISPA